MHLIRTLVVCLACLAGALLPARAACPMQAHAAHLSAPHAHHHEHPCPAPMGCCVPMAAQLATPAVAPSRTARRWPQPLLRHDRVREDAARTRLLRPPTSA